ncbi:hypothetical protein HYW59_04720 [Candidatus Kaiserbacteria bacterium]|nr:hypothetical protein [Candidatus Kaiserbacteria bacterium]
MAKPTSRSTGFGSDCKSSTKPFTTVVLAGHGEISELVLPIALAAIENGSGVLKDVTRTAQKAIQSYLVEVFESQNAVLLLGIGEDSMQDSPKRALEINVLHMAAGQKPFCLVVKDIADLEKVSYLRNAQVRKHLSRAIVLNDNADAGAPERLEVRFPALNANRIFFNAANRIDEAAKFLVDFVHQPMEA